MQAREIEGKPVGRGQALEGVRASAGGEGDWARQRAGRNVRERDTKREAGRIWDVYM